MKKKKKKNKLDFFKELRASKLREIESTPDPMRELDVIDVFRKEMIFMENRPMTGAALKGVFTGLGASVSGLTASTVGAAMIAPFVVAPVTAVVVVGGMLGSFYGGEYASKKVFKRSIDKSDLLNAIKSCRDELEVMETNILSQNLTNLISDKAFKAFVEDKPALKENFVKAVLSQEKKPKLFTLPKPPVPQRQNKNKGIE